MTAPAQRWEPPDKRRRPGRAAQQRTPGQTVELTQDDDDTIPDPNRPRDLVFSGCWKFADVEAVREALDWPATGIPRRDAVEAAVLAAALHAGRSDWTSYSRRKGWYQTRHYLPPLFSYSTLPPAVDRLAGLKLLDHDRKRPNPRPGYQSRFKASAELMRVVALKPRIVHNAPYNPVVLRDTDHRPLAFRQTSWTRRIARNVRIIEEMLSAARVDLDPQTPCLWRHGAFLELEDRHGEAYSIHVAHTAVARIFNGDFAAGGRFCGPGYQSWPKSTRRHITIDGAPTVERDYGQTHARMICAQAGLAIDARDLFDLAGYDRGLVKKVFHVMLNSCTLHEGLLAVANETRRKGTRKLAGDIVEALKRRFPPLTPFLHTGAGLRLMRLESDIAESVLLNLAEHGVVGLPIHDSFLVDAKNGPLLDAAMADSWGRFVGSPAVIS